MPLPNKPCHISLQTARRLAIACQHLDKRNHDPGPAGIMQVLDDIHCIQLDPINAVARSHLLVLWSRLVEFCPDDLDTLLWQEHSLFEYWAHAASIVRTADYPVFAYWMRHVQFESWTATPKYQQWLSANQHLIPYILEILDTRGPIPSREIQESDQGMKWVSGGWTTEVRNVPMMLDFLWMRGDVMVAGRKGNQKIWALTKHVLPGWVSAKNLSEGEVVRTSAEKSLQALGTGTETHIRKHFTRDRYPDLHSVLDELVSSGTILQVHIDGINQTTNPWYIHRQGLELLDQIETGNWQPRTTLLSPFDNLICDRDRSEILFNFHYRVEIYVPQDKREYGYYVMPILHGDCLIGRIDLKMDRKIKTLVVNNIFSEDIVQTGAEVNIPIREAIESLAAFLGAKHINYEGNIPQDWQYGFNI